MATRFVLPPLTAEQILDRLTARYSMLEPVELIRGSD